MKAARHIAWLTMVALVARLWWVWSSPWVAVDTSDYLALSRNLAFRYVFGLSNSTDAQVLPTASRPPLYPVLIALLWWTNSPPILAVMLLQSLLGAATVALVYLTAKDRFNSGVAMIASLGMALAPMTGRFTAVLLTETLFTFLLTLAVFCWGREKPVLAGLALGMAALTRPAVLGFIIILPMLSLLPSLRQRWRTYLTIAVVAIGLSSIWIIRDALLFRRFIPIAASGWGMNLLCGTIDIEIVGIKVWTGSKWALLDLSTHPLLQVEPGLSESERDRVLLRRGLERIVANPAHWAVVRTEQYPKLFLDSGDYFLGSHNIPITQAFAESRVWVLLVKGLFLAGNLFVIGMAVLGFITERKRVLSLIHIVSFPIFLLIVQIPMWTEARYSLPIMPMVAVFFAVGSWRLMQRTKLAIGSKCLKKSGAI